MKLTYSIVKHTTVEYIVLVQKDDEPLKTPVAKCNNEGTALTIKGMYEKDDAEQALEGEPE